MEIYGTKSVYYHVRSYNFRYFLRKKSGEMLCCRYVEGNLIFFLYRRVEFVLLSGGGGGGRA